MSDYDVYVSLGIAILLIGAIGKDVIRSIPWSAKIIAIALDYSKPFRPLIQPQDFLTAKELIENRKKLPRWKLYCSTLCAAVTCIFWAKNTVDLYFASSVHNREYLHTVAWFFFTFRHIRLRSITPHYALLFLAILEFVDWILVGSPTSVNRLAIFVLTLPILSILLSQPVEEIQVAPNIAPAKLAFVNESFISPEDGCTLFSWCLLAWIQPMLQLGYKRTIRPEDVWQQSPFLDAKNVSAVFDYTPDSDLFWQLIKHNGMDIGLDGFLQIGVSILSLAPTLFTKLILDAMGTSDASVRRGALKYALAALGIGLVRAQINVIHLYFAERAIARMRIQIISKIHHKALLRKDMQGAVDSARFSEAKKDSDKDQDIGGANVGRVVNLMSGDAINVCIATTYGLMFLELPIEFAISLFFLYQLMGWACLFGLIVLAVTIPLNNFMVTRNKKSRKAWKEAQDERINELNTMIRSIRFIKGNDWQDRWSKRVLDLRAKELRLLNKSRVLSLAFGLVWQLSPGLIFIASFAAYTNIFHQQLTIPIAFTAISLFSHLSAPLAMLPSLVLFMLQASVSSKRIANFLKEPEVASRACAFKRHPPKTKSEEVSIQGVFSWFKRDINADVEKSKGLNLATTERTPLLVANETASDLEPQTLKDFQVHVPEKIVFPQGLTIISGATASGKSSLLSALLGEMDQVSGDVHLDKDNGNVAYSASVPFLEHDTIKNNILFGASLDQDRYFQALTACALHQDLEHFDSGDLTKIGERGISLSGGQKARVALAKVAYSHARIVLLDDVLAAVDSHTARHLVENCLAAPIMRGRTIILVTHHLDLVRPYVKMMVGMESGFVISHDTYTDVQASSGLEAQSYETPTAKSSLDDEEEVLEGSVRFAVIKRYLLAIGWRVWLVIFLLQIMVRSSVLLQNWVIKTWGEAVNTGFPSINLHALFLPHMSDVLALRHAGASGTEDTCGTSLIRFGPFHWPAANNPTAWLTIYALCFLSANLLGLAVSASVFVGASNAAQRLFKDLLASVVRASTRWFDKVPVGRLLNRFSDDFNKIDGTIAMSFNGLTTTLLAILFSSIIVSAVLPPFLGAFVLLLALVWIASRPYVAASRSLRRLDSNSRSPIYSAFGELLHGIATIRAFGAEHRYESRFMDKLNAMVKLNWSYVMIRRWLRLRFDILTVTITAVTFALVLLSGISQGLAAIAIMFSQNIINNCLGLVQQTTTLEQDLNSIERVDTYIRNDDVEGPAVIEANRPLPSWPTLAANIIVKDLKVQYAPRLPDVLKGLTFEIKAKEKVALVGRTGSGKSTFSLALLRFLEARQGSIIVDGVDISKIGLSDLRKNITVMSQDAVLFQGTIKENLDPFSEYNDDELWVVLNRCQMVSTSQTSSAKPSRTQSTTDLVDIADAVSTSATTLVEKRQKITTLDAPVSENGNNFSAGERQLIALARALLRRPKILLMDEASSSIDMATDRVIQHFIKEAFADSLVITIAHRLATVIESDRVLVLDQGHLVQFDSPKELLRLKTGLFYDLCRDAADKEYLFHALSEPIPE